ncbi:glycoside hydrolase family 28 protein [Gracilimonas sp.]|uniref:glycoside hydrolase family 28 protein n=1 Tax=Gracilimonas sp. TaxID=1974203 RepID=UPI0032EF45F3
MKRLINLSFILLLTIGSVNCTYNNNTSKDYFAPVPVHYYAEFPFEMDEIPIPEFPDYSVNITEFGAVSDGETLNTEAISKAIDDVSNNGGGTVVIPRGIWLTGPIILKSNINLHVEKGALVKFSDNFDHYPLVETVFEGLDTWRAISPIYAKGVENIAITGEGIFDGSGGAWRPVKKFKVTEDHWEELIESGGVLSDDGRVWYPTEASKMGDPGTFNVPPNRETKEDYEEVRDFLRPVLVSIRESKNILLDGPTFQNSPAWNINPLMSENIILRNLTVRNPEYAQNGDGLDISSSKNVLVYNNSFDVGDDAICIKSGKNEDGRQRGVPTENVIIRDNSVYHAHGGFVVGSEMSGDVRNIHVADLTFMGTDVGIRFKSTRGRGGVVENIQIENIHMIDMVTEPIRFNLYYGGEMPTPNQKAEIVDKKKLQEQIPEVNEETPRFRDISIKNVYSFNSKTALWIQGLPEMSVRNVRMENMKLTASRGGMIMDAEDILMKNVDIEVNEGPVLFLNNVHSISLEDMNIGFAEDAGAGTGIRLVGPFSESVRLMGVRFTNTAEETSIGPNVGKGVLKRQEK